MKDILKKVCIGMMVGLCCGYFYNKKKRRYL